MRLYTLKTSVGFKAGETAVWKADTLEGSHTTRDGGKVLRIQAKRYASARNGVLSPLDGQNGTKMFYFEVPKTNILAIVDSD